MIIRLPSDERLIVPSTSNITAATLLQWLVAGLQNDTAAAGQSITAGHSSASSEHPFAGKPTPQCRTAVKVAATATTEAHELKRAVCWRRSSEHAQCSSAAVDSIGCQLGDMQEAVHTCNVQTGLRIPPWRA